jgi:hypothetical protein
MPTENALPQLKPIKIYLDESSDARHFDVNKDELIHQLEFLQATQLIEEAIKRAEKETPNRDRINEKRYSHHTITVLGTRGSGKTSFLLSLQRNFVDNEKLQVLGMIDPTLVEEKGHIFLNIIALISELVDKKLEEDEMRASKNVQPSRREWREQMLKLAAGLPGIDGIGKDNMDGWQDPEFVMDTGLRAVTSANNLATDLEHFMELSLSILGKQAFLLFFDDIDVDAKKGLSVLETIRKYLTTVKLITVLSGDLKLYSVLIRQKKWTGFGKEMIQYEGGKPARMSFFNDMITDLTTQYLLKVIQPKYRLHLSTLQEKKLFQKGLKVNIIIGNEGKQDQYEIEGLYKKIFEEFGVGSALQQEVYVTFMMGLPFRSQIQFLLCMNTKNINNELISDVFLAELLDKDVDVNLANHTPKYLCWIILKLLLNEYKLLDLYQLQPTTTDTSMNAALLALWMLLARYIERYSFLIFDYFIKIAFVRNVLTVIPYRDEKERNRALLTPSIQELCEIGDVHNDGVLRDVTSAMQAYILGALENAGNFNSITPFYIQLLALESVVKKGNKDRIDVVFARANKAACTLANIPCISGAYLHKNESRTMYSIHVLIGTIGEIIKRYEVVTADDAETEILDALKTLSQLRSYPVPNFKNNLGLAPARSEEAGGTGEDERKQSREEDKDTSDVELAKLVLDWIGARSNCRYSAHLLGKIYTRSYYAINNIANAVGKKDGIKLGQLFHYQVTAFMNAALVEDATENLEGSSLNINNARLSDSIFTGNLKRIVELKDKSEKMTISRWLLGCPLLIGYLKRIDEPFERNLKTFCGTSLDIRSFGYSIADKLNEVSISSQNEDKKDGRQKRRGRIYEPIAGSPALLQDRPRLISLLKKNKIPKRWFVNIRNKVQLNYRNESILAVASSIFGTGRNGIDNIDAFREFLRKNRDAWK